MGNLLRRAGREDGETTLLSLSLALAPLKAYDVRRAREIKQNR